MDIFFEGQYQPIIPYNDISSLPLIGDCIGMESCVDPMKDEDMEVPCKKEVDKCGQQYEKKLARKEFPPPIALLARTADLPAHMPWVLKRQYTDDGRLILTEEKVRYHEYFKVHRENGRLTLQLVPLEHHVFGMHDHDAEAALDSGFLEEEKDEAVFEKEDDDDDDRYRNTPDFPVENGNGDGGKMSAGKCLKYDSSVGLNSGCIFGVAMPAIEQVT